MNKPSLQALLQQQLSEYCQHHRLDANRLKICHHLLNCHTPALGGLAYECDHCEREIPRYHSCRDRHCPQCQQRDTRRWSERQQQAVLPVTYYHLVFTLPHELNGWIQLHDKTLYALLFNSVWHTLKTFGSDPKRLGGKLGMTAVLHTWGQNLSQHVHLHCLVPGGALGEDQRWHAAKSNYLFPVKALSRHYRGSMVSALRRSANEGRLHRIRNRDEVDRILDQLMQKDWVVYSRYSLSQTDSIIGYLSRYTHRIAISNQRIIDIQNDQVQFRYKDYRDEQQKLMTLQADEFIRRFLMHILPSGFMRIRHYGLLANRCRAKSIQLIQKILEAAVPKATKSSDEDPVSFPCPNCRKGRLVLKYEIAPNPYWAHPLPS